MVDGEVKPDYEQGLFNVSKLCNLHNEVFTFSLILRKTANPCMYAEERFLTQMEIPSRAVLI
jgi:hypothetical protein